MAATCDAGAARDGAGDAAAAQLSTLSFAVSDDGGSNAFTFPWTNLPDTFAKQNCAEPLLVWLDGGSADGAPTLFDFLSGTAPLPGLSQLAPACAADLVPASALNAEAQGILASVAAVEARDWAAAVKLARVNATRCCGVALTVLQRCLLVILDALKRDESKGCEEAGKRTAEYGPIVAAGMLEVACDLLRRHPDCDNTALAACTVLQYLTDSNEQAAQRARATGAPRALCALLRKSTDGQGVWMRRPMDDLDAFDFDKAAKFHLMAVMALATVCAGSSPDACDARARARTLGKGVLPIVFYLASRFSHVPDYKWGNGHLDALGFALSRLLAPDVEDVLASTVLDGAVTYLLDDPDCASFQAFMMDYVFVALAEAAATTADVSEALLRELLRKLCKSGALYVMVASTRAILGCQASFAKLMLWFCPYGPALLHEWGDLDLVLDALAYGRQLLCSAADCNDEDTPIFVTATTYVDAALRTYLGRADLDGEGAAAAVRAAAAERADRAANELLREEEASASTKPAGGKKQRGAARRRAAAGKAAHSSVETPAPAAEAAARDEDGTAEAVDEDAMAAAFQRGVAIASSSKPSKNALAAKAKAKAKAAGASGSVPPTVQRPTGASSRTPQSPPPPPRQPSAERAASKQAAPRRHRDAAAPSHPPPQSQPAAYTSPRAAGAADTSPDALLASLFPWMAPLPSAAAPPGADAPHEDDGLCVVCLEAPRGTPLLRCGGAHPPVLCAGCASRVLASASPVCPLCRA